MNGKEKEARWRLGIPDAAERVLVLAESSHWDPNWLFTSEEYFRLRIRRILDGALEELAKEPRRVYSVECIFFLKMYWDRFPEKRRAIRDLVNEGRLRLSGSGITTPDTTVPETEAILRDYLLGQEWLRGNGMRQEPSLAYFPDNFGHSPGVPAILAALGCRFAAVTRIDGMHFAGSDYRALSAYPRPGSSAALLQKELATLDFVWRAPDGSEVLCHWNAFTYGQGDTLDMIGPAKWMGLRLGLPHRSERHVARRIAGYVRRLAPLSRTPYLFCPIGLDFNHPIPGLFALLDRHNASELPRTGVYVVNAGMDDYLALVECHRDRLPVLELDPNPYFMGFPSSRSEVKQRSKRLTRKLLLAEKLGLVEELRRGAGESAAAAADLPRALGPVWEALALSNHHDYVTGTSPDRVWKKEQRPSLVEAESRVDRALAGFRAAFPPPNVPSESPRPLRWELAGGKLRIETDHHRLDLDEREGGCLTGWTDLESGRELLSGLGNDLVLYEDSGGLWRMGHEFRGGVFREVGRASRAPASIRARESSGFLVIEIESRIEGRDLSRILWLRPDSPLIRGRIAGSIGTYRTVTNRFAMSLSPRSIWMDVPGAVLERPLKKIFDPTFWAAKSFAHLRSGDGEGPGLGVFLFAPASLAANERGEVEWVALRNAPKEKAFGFLPLLAHPARGVVRDEQTLDYAIRATRSGDWRENRLPLLADEALRDFWLDPEATAAEAIAGSLIRTDDPDVVVVAVKRADRGAGIIVRLLSYAPAACEVRLASGARRIRSAWRSDARERDVERVPVSGGKARVPIARHIETVRLVLEEATACRRR